MLCNNIILFGTCINNNVYSKYLIICQFYTKYFIKNIGGHYYYYRNMNPTHSHIVQTVFELNVFNYLHRNLLSN